MTARHRRRAKRVAVRGSHRDSTKLHRRDVKVIVAPAARVPVQEVRDLALAKDAILRHRRGAKVVRVAPAIARHRRQVDRVRCRVDPVVLVIGLRLPEVLVRTVARVLVVQA